MILHSRAKPLALAGLATVSLLLGACAAAPSADRPLSQEHAPSSAASQGGHGQVEGAEELAEPALALVVGGGETPPRLLDLVTEEENELPFSSPALGLVGEGRFVAAHTSTGVDLVDSGRWSWDHGDHFHYYTASPRALGTLEGTGPVELRGSANSMAGNTIVHFKGDGRAIVLDNTVLAHADATAARRYEVRVGAGEVVPLDGAHTLAAGGGGSDDALADRAVVLDQEGHPTGVSAPCTHPAGAALTRAGAVIACDEGAVIATITGEDVSLTTASYPAGSGGVRPTTLSQRKGRAALAAPAGDSGFWLLDVRKAKWQLHSSKERLMQVTAVDDADGHVLALTEKGTLVVFVTGEGSGKSSRVSGETKQLLDPETVARLAPVLQVDFQRAYLNDPAGSRIFEIDYADGARVARTLTAVDGTLSMHEVGR